MKNTMQSYALFFACQEILWKNDEILTFIHYIVEQIPVFGGKLTKFHQTDGKLKEDELNDGANAAYALLTFCNKCQ